MTKADEGHAERLELLLTHHAKLAAIARRLVPNHADAADLLQELTIILLRSSLRFQNRTHFLTWSTGVLQRLVRKSQRNYVRQARLENEAGEYCSGAGFTGRNDPEARAANIELLSRGLTALEDASIGLLVSRYVDQTSATELAQDSAETPAAIRMRLARLRALMRRAMS